MVLIPSFCRISLTIFSLHEVIVLFGSCTYGEVSKHSTFFLGLTSFYMLSAVLLATRTRKHTIKIKVPTRWKKKGKRESERQANVHATSNRDQRQKTQDEPQSDARGDPRWHVGEVALMVFVNFTKIVRSCVSRMEMVILSCVFVRVYRRMGQGILREREHAHTREREGVFVKDRMSERLSERASECVGE